MTTISGFHFLVDGVKAFFEAQEWDTAIEGTFGKARWSQVNQGTGRANRVVFIYGARLDSTGDVVVDAGEFSAARGVGGNPRHLYTWKKKSVISVWARAPEGQTKDDIATIDAAENLLEKVFQALVSVTLADFLPKRISINASPNEQRYGVEYLVEFEHQGPIFDLPLERVTGVPRVDRGGFKENLDDLT